MQVTIIGAGIIGIQCAHQLLDDGHTVTLIDPDGLAERTSRGNAGMIAHTDISPLASPKMWRKLPRWLLDPMGPLSVRPAYALAILPWMLKFLASSSRSKLEASTAALYALNSLAMPAWERRLGKLGIADQHLRRRGYLYVWGNRGDFEAAKSGTLKQQQALGIPTEVLDNLASIRRLEPAFGGKAVGAAHYPTGAGVDNPATVSKRLGQLALDRGAVLKQKPVRSVFPVDGGVEIVTGDGAKFHADMAIIAAGAWSRPFAKALGDDVPLDTERGYNVTLPKGSLGLTRSIILDGEGVALSPFDDCDRLGGSVEFAGLVAKPNYARVDAILARTRPYLPDAKLDGGTRWMGFRPSLPDSLPVIGRSSASDRIIYAFGHSHYGLTESAATAEIVGALVGQRQSPIDVGPFAARRWGHVWTAPVRQVLS